MKAEDIKTIEDAQRYIEGCMNDFEAGISTKQQTIDYFAEYTLQIVKMAKKSLPGSKEKCKHNGRKRSDPLGGFYCVECGTFVNKKN